VIALIFRRGLLPLACAAGLVWGVGSAESHPLGRSADDSFPTREERVREVLGFADFLVANQEPRQAVHEYLRALWLTEGDTTGARYAAANGVARAHAAAGDFEEALRWARSPLIVGMHPCRLTELRLDAARCALRLERTGEAMAFLKPAAGQTCEEATARADQRDFLLGIASIQGGRWNEAAQWFSSVSPASPQTAAASQYRQLALQGPSLPYKDPRLAGWLGIVPGLGYYYDGFRQTAFAALVVNLVFAVASREAFRSDQNTLGGFLAAFGASWYTGSIYGSVQSAKRANDYQRVSFTRQFEY